MNTIADDLMAAIKTDPSVAREFQRVISLVLCPSCAGTGMVLVGGTYPHWCKTCGGTCRVVQS